MKVKVEVVGGPYDGEILEIDANRIHGGISMLDNTKMRMSTRPPTPEEAATPVPVVRMDIRRQDNKYYVFWPKEN